MEPVAFSSRYDDESKTLHLRGEIDDRALEQLRQTLRVLSSEVLTIDLNDVTYFPSAALGAVLAARKRGAGTGGGIRLVTAPGSIAATVLAALAVAFDVT